MQLGTLIALAILGFIAFSVGLNLGLHGVLSTHLQQQSPAKPQRTEASSSEVGSQVLSTSPAAVTALRRADTSAAATTTTAAAAAALGAATARPSAAPVVNPAGEKGKLDSLGAMQWSKARVLVEQALDKGGSYVEHVAIAKARITSSDSNSNSNGNMDLRGYLSRGGLLPVVLLTSTRASLLRLTLASLFSVRGVQKKNVLVVQDGQNVEVAEAVREAGITLLQNTHNLEIIRQRQGGGVDGAELIARHYKFALSSVFDAFADAPAAIIIEDDLLFSPDFYEYFHALGSLLDVDPSLMVISAWNDNGFKGKVQDPYALARTEFFPGLGWMLPRQLYKNELEQQWPTSHWDHWLRSPEIHRGREIVYPQVPRSYHNGVLGTFMNVETHNRYFRDIDYNTQRSVAWARPAAAALDPFVGAVAKVYEARVEQLIAACKHVTALTQIFEGAGIYCVWIHVDPEPAEYQPPDFEPVARFFGLWHEHKRGAHRGLHEFYFEDSYVLLLNTFNPSKDRVNGLPGIFVGSYAKFMPKNVVPIHQRNFDPRLVLQGRRRRLGVIGYPAGATDLACTQVCAQVGKQCRADWLPIVNDCPTLKKLFPCSECIESFGHEQPAFFVETYKCLVNLKPEISSCEAHHKATKRLCACA